MRYHINANSYTIYQNITLISKICDKKFINRINFLRQIKSIIRITRAFYIVTFHVINVRFFNIWDTN